MPRNGVLYQKTSNQVFCYLIDKAGRKGVHYCVLWDTYRTDGAKEGLDSVSEHLSTYSAKEGLDSVSGHLSH